MVTLLAVWLGLRVNQVRVQQRVVREVTELGGRVVYDYQRNQPDMGPPGPRWLQNRIGEDYFAGVISIDLDADRKARQKPGIDGSLLKDISRLPKLETLVAFRLEIDDRDMRRLARLRQLRTLCIGFITDQGVSELRNHPSLERLILGSRGNGFSDKSLEALSTITTLRDLTIHGKQITDKGLRNLGSMKQLESLFLMDVTVTPAGMSQLSGLQNLNRLGIHNSDGVTDAGLRHLASLDNLHELVLGDTRISDDGLSHLKTLTKLFHLNLVNTNVKGPGLKHLHSLTALRHLEVDSSVRKEDIEDLRRELPGCRVSIAARTRPSDDGS